MRVEERSVWKRLLRAVSLESVHRNHAEIHAGKKAFSRLGEGNSVCGAIVAAYRGANRRAGRNVVCWIGFDDRHSSRAGCDEKRVRTVAAGHLCIKHGAAAVSGFYGYAGEPCLGAIKDSVVGRAATCAVVFKNPSGHHTAFKEPEILIVENAIGNCELQLPGAGRDKSKSSGRSRHS